MKSDNYYGIGSNEYGLYKTVDNGRTWSILNGSSASSMTEAYNRIIFGSTEDKGLTYSDDGGVTIVNSDTTTGNWDGIAYENSVVYAHSMDGAGIAYSKDNGETWKILCGASADAVLAESDGYPIIIKQQDAAFLDEETIDDVQPEEYLSKEASKKIIEIFDNIK